MKNRKLAVGAALGLFGLTLGVYIVRAEPGGSTRGSLSFAGTLQGTSGAQQLKFTFKKAAQRVCSPQVTVTPDSASGAFNIEIPLVSCPGDLFDGAAVSFDVSVGSTVVAADQPVNPVPYARYADQVGTAECPVRYVRDTSDSTIWLCRSASGDEVVRVGSGPSAFWIDRYEASVRENSDGSGLAFGSTKDDYPPSFPKSGQWTTPLYAQSRSAVSPSRFLTWFQAAAACRASGKRLPTGEEWLAAARATVDPGVNDGTSGACVTMGPQRSTGGGKLCASAVGAQDLIGNLWEWTSEWYASIGNLDVSTQWSDPGYNDDGVWNIANPARGAGKSLPVAALRGGASGDGVNAGVFALNLKNSPGFADPSVGFRCVIPR